MNHPDSETRNEPVNPKGRVNQVRPWRACHTTKSDHQQQIHRQRKDLRAQNRPADTLYRRIAPAQLRTPPQRARGANFGLAGSFGPRILERHSHQHEFAA